MRGNGSQEWRGELPEFDGANAVDGGEFLRVARAALGHVEKRTVRKDEIGGEAPFLRQFEPQQLQGGEQRVVAASSCPIARAAFPPGPRLGGAIVECFRAAEQQAPFLRDRQAAVSGHINREPAAGHELAYERMPVVFLPPGANSKDGKPVMP